MVMQTAGQMRASLAGWERCEIPDWLDTRDFKWFHGGGYTYTVKGRSFMYRVITPTMECYRKPRDRS